MGQTETYWFRATDPNWDSVRFHIQWMQGDLETTGYTSSGAILYVDHAFPAGTHTIRVTAQDYWGVKGPFAEFTVKARSHAPYQATTPTGVEEGDAGTEYSYSTRATDPDGDWISYRFDWGDGTTSATGTVSSGVSSSAKHRWMDAGTYAVRTHAVDQFGEAGPWSVVRYVTINLPDAESFLTEEERRDACKSAGTDATLREALRCPGPIPLGMRLPANFLDALEFHAHSMATPNHDWDADGIPDPLDAVNLPSEAQSILGSSDVLDLAQGLPNRGFVFLLGPSHDAAYLVTAQTTTATSTITATDALAWFEQHYGASGRNTFAALLHENVTVTHQRILPNTPLVAQALPWTGSPADGSWILVRSDATRTVQLSLAGQVVPLAPPLASHPTATATNERWEFLNVHADSSFCYDAIMHTGASPCQGNVEPGWIRAYSGQAAYGLEALEWALHEGLIDPLVLVPEDVEETVNAAVQDAADVADHLIPRVFVDGALDTFSFASQSPWFPSALVAIELMAPDGRSMTFQSGPITTGNDVEIWRLDGTQVSGTSTWTAIGSLDGAAADGTWTWTILPGGGYASTDMETLPETPPDVTLTVAEKAIRAGFHSFAPAFNNPQIWNWHETREAFQDEFPVEIGSVDPDMQREEDPSLARFYPGHENGGSVGQTVEDAGGEATQRVGELEDEAANASLLIEEVIQVVEDERGPAAQVFATAADTFRFSAGDSVNVGVEITLTAPNQQSMTFTRPPTAPIGDGTAQVWSLDGTRVSGADTWSATGNLVGVPADGTWQWSITSTGIYNSYDASTTVTYRPDPRLSVAGKRIEASFAWDNPAFNNPQLWNWHVTTLNYQDDRADNTLTPVDTQIQPDEDPQYARYFDAENPIGSLEDVPGMMEELTDSETAQVFVTGQDTFTFASGTSGLLSPTIDIVLTAPNGQSMTFTRADPLGLNEEPPQVWSLAGTRISGPETWTATGSLVGAPADGTWQWAFPVSTSFYASEDAGSFSGSRPDVTLQVAGKEIQSPFNGFWPYVNNPQLWNWHISGASFQDDGGILPDPVDAEEDPSNARYYDATGHAMPMQSQSSSTSWLTGLQDTLEGALNAFQATRQPSFIPPDFQAPLAGRTVFDEESSWRILGEHSRLLPRGVGSDYLFDVPGLDAGESLLRQTKSLDDTAPPAQLRPFLFEGHYVRIPGIPTDLRSLTIGIEALDGPTGQAFILDGRALDELLDFAGLPPIVEIDDDHASGFQYEYRDVDGDGYADLVIEVPHFSQSWIRVASSQIGSNARFWDVEATSPNHAWMTGNDGAVYEYFAPSGANAYIMRHPIQTSTAAVATSQEAFGLHLISSNEFYVSGEGDCNAGKTAFIAHYNGGFQSITWKGTCYAHLFDVWVNPSKTRGFAVGSSINVLEFNGQSWQTTSAPGRPSDCGFTDIEFTDAGQGYIAAAAAEQCSTSAIHYFDGAQFTPQTVTGSPAFYDVRDGGEFAVGLTSTGPGIWKQSGTNWNQVTPSGGNPPSYRFFGADKMPGTSTTWIVGADGNNRAAIVKHTGSSFTSNGFTVDSNLPSAFSLLEDVDLYDATFGLAVGYNVILQFNGNNAPTATGSISPTTGITTQTYVAATSTSTDPDGDALTHVWDWGDGSANGVGASVSHRYSDIGYYTITLTVTDPDGAQASKSFNVYVDAASLNLPSTSTVSFSGLAKQRQHFQVPASSGKVVEAKLTGANCAATKLLAQMDYMVPSYATQTTWPSDGYVSTTKLAGLAAGRLYLAVEKAEGTSTSTCTLSVKQIAAPNAPTMTSAPTSAGSYFQVAATITHPDGYASSLNVQWANQGTTTGFERATGQTHTLASPAMPAGTHTLTLRAIDEFGRMGASITHTVTVTLAPSVLAQDATTITDSSASLGGYIGSTGGATTINARLLVYRGASATGTPVINHDYGARSAGTLPFNTHSGLTAGTTYTFVIQGESAAYTVTSDPKSFNTQSTVTTTPTITGASTATAGTSYSLSLLASGATNVAYWVTWGDGSTTRHPATGHVSPSSTQTATHTYALPYGFAYKGIQVEASSGARGPTSGHAVTVGGTSPVAAVTHVSNANTVSVAATLDQVVEDGATQARFKYHDGNTYQYSPWRVGLGDSTTVASWTTSTLAYTKTYSIQVELQASAGRIYTAPQSWVVQTNRAPTLQVLDATQDATYLDQVTFRALYRDTEGNAPTVIQAQVNGQNLNMHPAPGTPNYVAGVEYSYTLTGQELGAPGKHRATYIAGDGIQAWTTKALSANYATIKQSSVAAYTFEGNADGTVPTGFTRGSGSLNYWQVANTDAEGFPQLAALGGHGKAAWFGKSPQGTYGDPEGGKPKGSLTTIAYDLASIESPVLSFASYHDTGATTGDKMFVKVFQREYGYYGYQWTAPTPLSTIAGTDPGYKAWRTQTIDLAAYADKVVKFEFRFEADGIQDAYLGWLIDDVAIGHDHDGDGLPDALENGRIEAHLAHQAASITVPALSNGVAAVRNVQHVGAEAVIAEILVKTTTPDDVDLILQVRPSRSSNTNPTAAPLASYSYPASTGSICALTTPRASQYVSWLTTPKGFMGQPSVGLPNLPYDFGAGASGLQVKSSNSGLQVQVDLTKCFTAGTLTSGTPQDIELYAESDGAALVVESFRVTAYGRTSPFDVDSDADGAPDTGELAGASAISSDPDRDASRRTVDTKDGSPNQIPAFFVDLDNQANEVRFGIQALQSYHFDLLASKGKGFASMSQAPHVAQNDWVVYTMKEGVAPYQTIQATFRGEDSSTLTLALSVHETSHKVSGVTAEYEADWFQARQLFGTETVANQRGIAFVAKMGANVIGDQVSEYAGDLTKAYLRGVPAAALAAFAVEQLVEPIVRTASEGALLKFFGQTYSTELVPMGSYQAAAKSGYTYATLKLPDGYDATLFPGYANKAAIVSAMGSAAGPYKGLGVERWFVTQDLASSTRIQVLESEHSYVRQGWVWEYPDFAQIRGVGFGDLNDDFTDLQIALSLEREVSIADSVSYASLVCHLVCTPWSDGSQVLRHTPVLYYGPGDPVTGIENPNFDAENEWIRAMRFQEQKGAQKVGDPIKSQTATALMGFLKVHRFANAFEPDPGVGPTFADYHGDHEADCAIAGAGDRRCRQLEFDGHSTATTPELYSKPFILEWHRTGSSPTVDAGIASGWYRHNALGESANWAAGYSVIEGTQTGLQGSLASSMPCACGDKVLVAMDTTRALGDSSSWMGVPPSSQYGAAYA